MKYIASKYDIVMFTGGLSHQEVANRLKNTYFGEAESAGFVHGLGADIEEIKTVGESVSLKLKSRPEDAQMIIKDIRGY